MKTLCPILQVKSPSTINLNFIYLFMYHWRRKCLREVSHQQVYEAWRFGQSEDEQCVKWWSQSVNTLSCCSSSSLSIISSSTLSTSTLSSKLRTGTSMPLLALHSNGSHECSICTFVCFSLCLMSSSASRSAPMSLACLNMNAAKWL